MGVSKVFGATVLAGAGLIASGQGAASRGVTVYKGDIAAGSVVLFNGPTEIQGAILLGAFVRVVDGYLNVTKNVGDGVKITLDAPSGGYGVFNDPDLDIGGDVGHNVTLEAHSVTLGGAAGNFLKVVAGQNFSAGIIGANADIDVAEKLDFASAGIRAKLGAAWVRGSQLGYEGIVHSRFTTQIETIEAGSTLSAGNKIIAEKAGDFVSMTAGNSITVAKSAGDYAYMRATGGDIEIDAGEKGDEATPGACLRFWPDDDVPRTSLGRDADIQTTYGSIIVHTTMPPASFAAGKDVLVRHVTGMSTRYLAVRAGGQRYTPYTCEPKIP